MAETSLQTLQRVWPATHQALKDTYYPSDSFGRTYDDHLNDAGYILAGLTRYEIHWRAVHGHHQVAQHTLDKAAAHEIYYHWSRGRVFNRPVCALSTAIVNMVTERPEKILVRHRRLEAKRENARTDSSSVPESNRRRYDLSQAHMSMLSRDVRSTNPPRADRRPGA